MTEKLNDIIFYALEKSIKSYRQFAQRNLDNKGYHISIDQWLILKTLQENHDITQQQVAEIVFKDYASVTRIIDILVEKKFIVRSSHLTDRRRFKLTLTPTGKKLLTQIQKDINEHRSKALSNISKTEMTALRDTLNKIVGNCT
jgi:DNA-binding MarR family transcriptional regulator